MEVQNIIPTATIKMNVNDVLMQIRMMEIAVEHTGDIDHKAILRDYKDLFKRMTGSEYGTRGIQTA